MNDPYYMQQIKCRKKGRMNFLIRLFSAFYLLHRYALILIAIDIIDLRSINAGLLINN